MHSDNAFNNEVMARLAKELNFRHTFSSPYHPQGNPYVERFMKPLGDALTAYVNKYKQNNWDQFLAPVAFAYNTRVHSTIGFSPFFLTTGQDAHLPTDVIAGIERARVMRNYEDTTPFIEGLAAAYELARKRLQESARKRKLAYDSKHLDSVFSTDSIVMVYYERGRCPCRTASA